MLSETLISLFERDLCRVIEELNLYKNIKLSYKKPLQVAEVVFCLGFEILTNWI